MKGSKAIMNEYHITFSFDGDGDLHYSTRLAHSLRDAWSLLKFEVGQKIIFHSATCESYYFSKVN